ncbi:uncharacterized protein PV09_09690 [Verruconis gallopava]|uniref:Uncharacterized protein n=1 Tax=Verruconis gallopava TaxID=253628 RepID=A0A0D1ZVP4_9PEZI|nr:uncharacterized protein PV09_09690 [Verruconis gallopava]KIV98502.1 hypothetical protein PV09_09690 [Verruconis gallopava]
MSATLRRSTEIRTRGRGDKGGKSLIVAEARARETIRTAQKITTVGYSACNGITIGSVITWPSNARLLANKNNPSRSIGRVWGIHDDWLFVQKYVSGWDMEEQHCDVCVPEFDVYIPCDVFDVILRNSKVRKIDVYDMESDRIFDGIFEVKGNGGKGRLWIDGSIDDNESRLARLLRGPA